jgi:2'-5' RNA ligase
MSKRLFIAIKILPESKFREIFQSLKVELDDERIKWVEMENIHVTLKFFGDTDEKQIPLITAAVRRGVITVPSFDIELRHLGLFGGYYKPRVIWAGIEPLEPLQELSSAVNKAILPLGYPLPEEPFTPHLTLGRIKFVRDKKKLANLVDKQKDASLQVQHIDSLYLFESILRSQGPLYQALEKFDLLK